MACVWRATPRQVHDRRIAIQTFGDVLGFNPHCDILVTVGCFYTFMPDTGGFDWYALAASVIAFIGCNTSSGK